MVRTAVALDSEVEFVVAKVLKTGNARRRGARFRDFRWTPPESENRTAALYALAKDAILRTPDCKERTRFRSPGLRKTTDAPELRSPRCIR